MDVIDAGFPIVADWDAMAEADTTDHGVQLAGWHARLAPVIPALHAVWVGTRPPARGTWPILME